MTRNWPAAGAEPRRTREWNDTAYESAVAMYCAIRALSRALSTWARTTGKGPPR